MTDRAMIAQLVPRLLEQSPMTRRRLQDLMTAIGMSEQRAGALIQELPGGCDASVDIPTFVEIVFGADGAAAAYLVAHGISQPTEADIAYFHEQQLKAVNDSFVKHAIKMKPLDLNQFGADYFSGALAEQKRLVLISSDAGKIDLLQSAVKPIGNMGAPIVTATWDFNGSPAQMVETCKALVEKHGTFKTIALCCHDGGGDEDSPPTVQSQHFWMEAQWEAAGKPLLDGKPDRNAVNKFIESNGPVEVNEGLPQKWFLMQSFGIDLATGQEDPGISDVIKAVAEAASVRVDILACSLAGTDQGRAWVQKCEKEFGTNFAASTDVTGNAAQGANWVLETDGIDLCDVYFDAKKIGAWQITLGKGKYPCKSCANRTNFDNRLCGNCRKKGGGGGGSKLPPGGWKDSARKGRMQGGYLVCELEGAWVPGGSPWFHARGFVRGPGDTFGNDDGCLVRNGDRLEKGQAVRNDDRLDEDDEDFEYRRYW